MRKKYIIFILIFLFLVVFLYLISQNDNKNDISVNKYSELNTQKFVPVKVQKAFIGDLNIYIKSQGRAQAFRKSPLIFKKSAYLKELKYKEGEIVKKGSLLAILQNDEEYISVKESQAGLIKSIAEFTERTGDNSDALKIIQKNLLNKKEIDSNYFDKFDISGLDSLAHLTLDGKNRSEVIMAVSGLSQSIANFNKTLLNYRRTFFYAPFTSVIGNLIVIQGEYVKAGEPIAVLYDLTKIKIYADLLEDETPFINIGAKCYVNFSVFPDKEFIGKVYEKNPALDEETHTLRITILLSNGAKGILPGMNAEIQIIAEKQKDVLLVPKEAVLERDGKQLVFAVRDSVAFWCYITPGRSNDKYTQVLDSEFNLKSGEPVITEGHFTLAHGAKVKIKNE